MDFDTAVRLVLAREGGYVNSPRDPGGETKYGISKRRYPGEDIANLTPERAAELYRRDFWGPAGCDGLPDTLKFPVFDAAVNTSPKQAIECLQQALGCFADGVIGAHTLQAAQTLDPKTTKLWFFAHLIRYYTGLRQELRDAFLTGWMNRVADNMLE